MPTNFNPLGVDLNTPSMFDPAGDQSETTSTAQQVLDDQNIPEESPEPKVDPKIKKRNGEFRTRVDACKAYRRKLISNWSVSIDYRRGKPFTSQADEDQVAVNLDWALTKAKQAQLFSQVPKVRINHGEELLIKTAPWVIPFEKTLNDILLEGGIESTMDECLPDCINAAGFGVALVSYEAITEDAQLPSADPSVQPDSPMVTVPRVVDHRYLVQRLSPADFLWPINFTGANFDNAPWLGRSGRVTWAEAVQQWGLKEDDKDSILGEDRPMMDRLTHDVERDKSSADEMVGFDELWFKEFQYDPTANSYFTLHHLVFVNGKDDPVVDEPWKGQKPGGTGIIGAKRFPVRVLTLAYITDEAIPPSDSAIGRPQVNELNKVRTQWIHQRERSIPIRWFDVNRIDPAIQQSLLRGTWQAMIPTQGDGSRSIGEVARAGTPPENFKFDQIVKADLMQAWVIGPNQMGNGEGVETKGEANNIQSGVNTQVTRERAKTASFFTGIADVMGGLMCLYEDPATFGQGFDPGFSTKLRCSVLADSTVLLDANQRLARLNNFLNVYGKSGWVNLEPVLHEIAQLSGLDPSVVVQPPQPKPPVEPNISLRLTGVEDMLNPLALAFLIKSGQAPTGDLIEQAKALIQQAVVPPQGMEMPGSVQPLGGLPMLPQGAGGPPPPGAPPQGQPLPPPQAAPPPGTPMPIAPPPRVGEAHPNWTTMNKLSKRSEGGQ